jgi:hypothetical protein
MLDAFDPLGQSPLGDGLLAAYSRQTLLGTEQRIA